MQRTQLPTRLFIKNNLKLGEIIEITSKQMHYLSNVMRKKVGDKICVFNGIDGEYINEIIEKNKKNIFCECKNKIRDQSTENEVWLLLAPIKKDRLLYLVEKGTELGITNFQPLITEYTQIKKINLERLTLNAHEAAEQTERLSVPVISPPQKLKSFIKKWPKKNIIIFCDETNTEDSLTKLLSNLIFKFPIAILVGPEGGFSISEKNFLNEFKFVHQVSLGKRILRSDTAMVSALSIFQSISGDWYK